MNSCGCISWARKGRGGASSVNPTQVHIYIDTTPGPLCTKSCLASSILGVAGKRTVDTWTAPWHMQKPSAQRKPDGFRNFWQFTEDPPHCSLLLAVRPQGSAHPCPTPPSSSGGAPRVPWAERGKSRCGKKNPGLQSLDRAPPYSGNWATTSSSRQPLWLSTGICFLN